jgi:pimeloyl-ACP methyl ester carboxylesterase
VLEEEKVESKTPNNSRGQMIDLGGYRLYCQVSGEGGPVVVMEAGLGSPSDMLYWVEQEISKFTTVFSYERAGLGRSESDNRPVDFDEVVRQLHTLLHKAGIEGPYILLGHSLGGLFIRGFAEKYPGEVAGLVSLDGTHPEQFKRTPKWVVRQRKLVSKLLYIRWLAKILLKADTARNCRGLPAEQIARMQAAYGSDKHLTRMLAEIKVDEKLMAAAGKTGKVGSTPLIVFNSGLPKASYMPLWQQMQKELAELSTNSTYIFMPDATHVSLVTERENALTIAAAVQKMVEEIRANQ